MKWIKWILLGLIVIVAWKAYQCKKSTAFKNTWGACISAGIKGLNPAGQFGAAL
jgi:hypothetical protein